MSFMYKIVFSHHLFVTHICFRNDTIDTTSLYYIVKY